MCWYTEEVSATQLGKYISVTPKVVAGKLDSLDDNTLWDFYDSLGSFPDRNDILDNIYVALRTEYLRRDSLNETIQYP
jgi:hypothetical protein